MEKIKNMKCPNCGKTLKKIDLYPGEYYCDNENCIAVKEHSKMTNASGYPEFYGDTQKEINDQKDVYKKICGI